jgi:hypothetical protein
MQMLLLEILKKGITAIADSFYNFFVKAFAVPLSTLKQLLLPVCK